MRATSVCPRVHESRCAVPVLNWSLFFTPDCSLLLVVGERGGNGLSLLRFFNTRSIKVLSIAGGGSVHPPLPKGDPEAKLNRIELLRGAISAPEATVAPP